jgi:hypothetical protein
MLATTQGPRREQMIDVEERAGRQLDAARAFADQARAARIAAQRNEDFLGDCMNSLGHCASECWHCGCLDPCCPAEWGSRGRDCPPALKWCICGAVTALVVGVTVGALA